MRRLIALLFAAFCSAAGAQLPAGCEGDASLTGRTDVALCEAFESSTWWQNGYKEDGSKTNPPPASSADSTEIVSSGCVSGNCLQGNYPACTPGGPSASGVLAHHKTIPGNLEEVYLRYYIKLASNFAQPFYSTVNCTTFANDHSGKFPGVGDVRTGSDGTAPPPSTAVGQCGNGGDVSDGLWCWSARMQYRNCISSTSVGDEPYTTGQDICEQDIHGKTATTRFGFYWYLPGGGLGQTNQASGTWDHYATGTPGYGTNCAADPNALGNWTAPKCGIGEGGLVPDHWYLVEIYHKMNTPGSANGVARGWLNGVLKWEKTNVVYRNVGHDNLHVRTLWLNIHGGGEAQASLQATNVWIDQLVVLDASGWGGNMSMRPGPWKKPGAVYLP